MVVSNSEFPVVRVAKKTEGILFKDEKIFMKLARDEVTRKVNKEQVVDDGLLGKLKALRLEIARRERVPAFIVFSDATLMDMCRVMPHDESEFLKIINDF